MRYAMLLGCVWLGTSVAACGGMRAEAPLLDEKPVATSSGAGGAAELDTGRWARVVETPQAEQERRELYEQVAQELGLDTRRAAPRGPQVLPGEAVGGGGRQGGERRSCAEVLAANEPTAVVSGTLEFALDGLLTVNVPGQGPMKLRSDSSTCAVQARQERGPESLLVGTEVRAAYVLEDGLPTARVVRAAPVRPTR